MVNTLQYICVTNHHIAHFNVYNVMCQLYPYKTGKTSKNWEVTTSGYQLRLGGDESSRKSKFGFGNGSTMLWIYKTTTTIFNYTF